jgi:hypothetical protein
MSDAAGDAEISFIAEGAGGLIDPAPGLAGLEILATGVGAYTRQKVRVISTAPHSRRGNTGLSHTGLN